MVSCGDYRRRRFARFRPGHVMADSRIFAACSALKRSIVAGSLTAWKIVEGRGAGDSDRFQKIFGCGWGCVLMPGMVARGEGTAQPNGRQMVEQRTDGRAATSPPVPDRERL